MSSGSDLTTSVWMEASRPEFPSLQEDLSVDVCIVGAGIAGLTTAYQLACKGKNVVVLDDGEIGSGETGRTTAHITATLDDRYFELERLHGAEGARLAAESHSAAIDYIESVVAEEGIDCRFERVDGYLFVPPGQSAEVLEREYEAAQKAGLHEVELVERAPLPFFDTGSCLHFPRQAQFHPMNYLVGLAGAIQKKGGRIFTRTHVTDFKGGASGCVVAENGHTVRADAIVIATNTPVNDRFVIHTKQAAYRSYVIGLQVPRGSVPRGLYWDTPDPYHYVRLTSPTDQQYDILIVGGEDHKTGQEEEKGEEAFACLEEWTRERFPMAAEVLFRWSGQIMEPVDGLAFIGPNPMDDSNVYIATGDSGNGITHGTIAGMLLADLITGNSNPWQSLYDPSRKTLGAISEFTRENVNVAIQYTDWLSSGDVESVEDIPPGGGAIMRHGLNKVAVYRDKAGMIHTLSAHCPHLGCAVQWNGTEHTWDCPCHGSRFDPHGAVINGPANTNLPPAQPPNGDHKGHRQEPREIEAGRESDAKRRGE